MGDGRPFGEFCYVLKGEITSIMPTLHESFQKTEEKGTRFMRPDFLGTKPDKDIKRKKKKKDRDQYLSEHQEILNQILSN